MNPGKLRHRLTFSIPTYTQLQSGEETLTFVQLGTVWGSIEDLSGREVIQAGQQLADVSTRIRCRFLAGVTPECRIEGRRRTFDIVHLNNVDNVNKEYEILCRTPEDNV